MQAQGMEKYRDGFLKPKIWPSELERKFKPKETYFVTSMGDLFGNWVSDDWIRRVLEHVNKFEETTFFFETKNPARYKDYLDLFPKNAILSTTIESNRDYKASAAPSVWDRFEAFKGIEWPTKHVSIEPIMEFDLSELAGMVLGLRPWMVAVGYDSLGNNLVEPELKKSLGLIVKLEREGFRVERKLLREKNTKYTLDTYVH